MTWYLWVAFGQQDFLNWETEKWEWERNVQRRRRWEVIRKIKYREVFKLSDTIFYFYILTSLKLLFIKFRFSIISKYSKFKFPPTWFWIIMIISRNFATIPNPWLTWPRCTAAVCLTNNQASSNRCHHSPAARGRGNLNLIFIQRHNNLTRV